MGAASVESVMLTSFSARYGCIFRCTVLPFRALCSVMWRRMRLDLSTEEPCKVLSKQVFSPAVHRYCYIQKRVGATCAPVLENAICVRSNDLIRPDFELSEGRRAERGGQRGIDGVSAVGHENAADARDVVSGVEGVPLAAQKRLEPSAEVHRGVRERNADVAQVTSGVTGWNVHATAESNGEVGEIAANPGPFRIYVVGRLGRAGEGIAEADVVMHPVADGLYSAPACRRIVEEIPRDIGKAIDLAITAGKEERQYVGRQVLDRELDGVRVERVGLAEILDLRIVPKPHAPGGRDDAGTAVAESVHEVVAPYN